MMRNKYKIKSLEEKFWAKAIVKGSNDCWIWNGWTDKYGYGCTSHRGKHWLAHRLSFYIHHKELPDDMCVCHHCDNPPCVNPKHLFLGTPKDNRQDSIKKGRVTFKSGEGALNVKLSDNDIGKIRALYKTGDYYQAELGNMFGVSQGLISTIVRKRHR